MNTHEIAGRIEKTLEAVDYSFVGRREIVEIVLMGLFSGLHVLVEDVPGVGKTTLAKTLSCVSGLEFGRIQLSPDVLPGDIIGMHIYDTDSNQFVFRPGAIEHQFVLADELNRASERTQSALLEAMQEEQVTVDGLTRDLPQPFFLIATQNPSRFAGTFRLPESQLDRFGLACSIGYPTPDHELEILDRVAEGKDPHDAPQIFTPDEIKTVRNACDRITVSQGIRRYVIALASATRKSRQLEAGVSPRATGQLLRAARAAALCAGRDYVMPEDVRRLCPSVFLHRLLLSTEARVGADSLPDVLQDIMDQVPMPIEG